MVCPGTQNGLSSTGSQENQYNLIKDRYDGCEIVMGNLEITQIESNWDFSFLKVKVILFTLSESDAVIRKSFKAVFPDVICSVFIALSH